MNNQSIVNRRALRRRQQTLSSLKRNGNGTDILEQLELGPSQVIDEYTTLIMKIPGQIVPKSIMVRLTFPDTTTVRIGTASPTENWSIRSSAYDPDPSFLTGAMPGFTEWAAFYAAYRVHGIGVRGQVSNPETFAQMLLFFPYAGSTTSNNTLSGSQIYERSGNPLAWSTMLSPSNGGRATLSIRKFWKLTKILGSTQWLTDDGYAAPTTGNPSSFVNILGASYNPTGGNLTVGVITNLKYDMDVEFFSRKTLLS